MQSSEKRVFSTSADHHGPRVTNVSSALADHATRKTDERYYFYVY
jgi:hypothetical protein